MRAWSEAVIGAVGALVAPVVVTRCVMSLSRSVGCWGISSTITVIIVYYLTAASSAVNHGTVRVCIHALMRWRLRDTLTSREIPP